MTFGTVGGCVTNLAMLPPYSQLAWKLKYENANIPKNSFEFSNASYAYTCGADAHTSLAVCVTEMLVSHIHVGQMLKPVLLFVLPSTNV
jgi:hypothetical protein